MPRKFTQKKEKEYTQEMDQPIQKIEQPLYKILYRNLLGGIAWGIGVTIGATILLALIGYFVSQLNYVPIVGGFVTDIVNFVETNNPAINNLNELEQ